MRNGIDAFFTFFLGKIPVHHIGKWAMQTIILVLGAKILINLHQSLILFFRMQDPEHFFLIAKNIMFHKSK